MSLLVRDVDVAENSRSNRCDIDNRLVAVDGAIVLFASLTMVELLP